jgi:photosystem II stability/assembly factor-like uncharacterized protein
MNTQGISSNLHVYAGTAGHSAWFSEDGGETWVHPNSHSGMYLEARVWTFATHPSTPERLFAGSDMGVFRWDEESARWTHLPSPMTDVWALAQHPGDPDILIAGSRPAALYKSRDAGVTWEKLNVEGVDQFSTVNMGPTRVTQILFDPIDPRLAWATVEIGGIFRSNDGGDTWESCCNGLVSRDVHGILAIRDGNGHPVVFATTNMGFHRSDDQGASWNLQQLDAPWQYTRSVVQHPTDGSMIFVTAGNGPPGNDGRLLRSRDYGRTFETSPLPLPINSTVWCLVADPSNPDVLFACTNLGRVFRSDDRGDSWKKLDHEFGELRALTWRCLPTGIRKADHSITRRTVRAEETTQHQKELSQ